ncbi:hypothetical protein BX616_006703 [Lobosporangium transversale]|uniref:Uncharacterized protein n=1 Tax=Lobosporangium transversale TaxID=64571 RepID=A0A1Y2H3T0_9FUNG|nr:hypothetical protein BCR41DRAFT_418459 [Lobosporangium transversale]KAF9915185.1 hypothetical protein BX616_006703 [Lobosporangium transversale]ORZ28373.1 hypothetical protein BCR41DRAFT_418459 [Lobosporangium transversale]|eukprot:XP_021886058.1 hypothetical protein BCR41DRAFT_418459 [Lobosporangium transversale]
MFARQVDPLMHFRSSLSVAEQHHRIQQEMVDQHSDSTFFSVAQPSPHNIQSINSNVNIIDNNILCTSNFLPSDFSGNDGNNGNNYSRNYINNNTCDLNNINTNTSKKSTGTDTATSTTNADSNPYKRKHTFHFEPEFFAALDETTSDGEIIGKKNNPMSTTSTSPQRTGFSWMARPLKRAKRSKSNLASLNPNFNPVYEYEASPHQMNNVSSSLSASQCTVPSFSTISALRPTSGNNITCSTSTSTFATTAKSPSSSKIATAKTNPSMRYLNLNGPSIIDLSSGEELVVLHLGNNELKRRRDDSLLSSSTRTENFLLKAYEYKDDGTLTPIPDLDHRERPFTQPSPAKKVRLSRSNQRGPHLEFIEDCEAVSVDDHQRGLTGEEKWSQKSVDRDNGRDGSKGRGGFYQSTEGGRYHRPTVYGAFWNGTGTSVRLRGSRNMRRGSRKATVGTRFWADFDQEGSRINKGDDEAKDELEIPFANDSEDKDENEVQDKEKARVGGGNLVRSKNVCNLFYLAEGFEKPSQSHWRDLARAHFIPENEAEVHELVLYRSPDLTNDSIEDNILNYDGVWDADEFHRQYHHHTSAFIEELNEDTGNGDVAEVDYDGDDDDDGIDDDNDGGVIPDNEAGSPPENAHLMDLEEKIMDMDLN